MSNLTTKQRNALPDSDFCYVSGSGDKKVRLFPALDQDDIDSAKRLIGKSPDPESTKACFVRKGKAKGWKIPDAWQGTVKNGAGAGEDIGIVFGADEMVIKRGKIFEAGEYPDKGSDFTPEDLLRAVVDFSPMPMTSGHPRYDSPLERLRLLGEVRAIALADDGVSLEAEVAVPTWLAEQLPPDEFKVSCEWTPETKALSGLSYVLEPRVTDAALLAAFAKRHDTPIGQRIIQRVHDVAAEGGAVCKRANADFASSHEASAVQQIHDVTTEHGAKCHDAGKGLSMGPFMFSDQPPASAGQQPARRGLMSLMNFFKRTVAAMPDDADPQELLAAFGAGAPATGTTPTASVTPAPTPPADTEKDALKLELARERAKGILRDAEAFADRIIEKEERAVPSEHDAIIAAYCQAAQDDIHFGPVTFANGTQGNRLGVLTATYAARPAHMLTEEQVRGDLRAVLYNRTETKNPNDPNRPSTPEERDALIGLTPTGAQYLRERTGSRNN